MERFPFLAVFTLVLVFLSSCEKSDRRQQIKSFKSDYVDDRQIDIYLPESYYRTTQKYPVLYMHDGQNIFDSETSYGGVSWQVDSIVDVLVNKGVIEEVIVVGIWNNGAKRGCEYQPEKPFDQNNNLSQGILQSFNCEEMLSDEYLKFLTEELKPFIDRSLRVKKNQQNTFISGSSMGGLISLYALAEYPEIYGGGACISTHWLSTTNYKEGIDTTRFTKILQYLHDKLSPEYDQSIYFDYGNATLDSLYAPYQSRVDSLMQAKGFESTNWQTKKFPGQAHNEASWKSRYHVALEFLLGKND